MVTGIEAARYAAFISYSHKDAAAARALHGRLERYRIPKRLVGTAGDHGPVPARLTPIFRDRDELPAAGDLSEKVRAALAASDSLVVLCSPHSAGSLWVAREIAAFRELHPGRPVLAAVVAGDPGECFPAGLSGLDAAGAPVEPLAADLRKAGDGQRLGFLKLVAGLTGIGLDALVQRDAARAIRRVTAVTLTALAATLVMAVLTMVALNARREADRQRAEAEGLVEFMLTDLRDRLKGVGRLDVLTDVNQRALDHYARQDLAGLSPDALERRARILHAMGEDDSKRGQYDRARALFDQARRTTATLLAADQDNPERIFAHGQSEYWVGFAHQKRGDWQSARVYYARYAAAGRRLIEIDPRNPDYMMERGWGPLNLGIVELSGLRHSAQAEREFKEAITWFEKVTRIRAKDPAPLSELANAYAWLADSFYVRNLLRPSLDARQNQMRIAERLLALDPANAERGYDLAKAARGVGGVAASLGDWAIAERAFGQAQQQLQRLVAIDGTNLDWVALKAKADCDVARTASRLPPPGMPTKVSPAPSRRQFAGQLARACPLARSNS